MIRPAVPRRGGRPAGPAPPRRTRGRTAVRGLEQRHPKSRLRLLRLVLPRPSRSRSRSDIRLSVVRRRLEVARGGGAGAVQRVLLRVRGALRRWRRNRSAPFRSRFLSARRRALCARARPRGGASRTPEWPRGEGSASPSRSPSRSPAAARFLRRRFRFRESSARIVRDACGGEERRRGGSRAPRSVRARAVPAEHLARSASAAARAGAPPRGVRGLEGGDANRNGVFENRRVPPGRARGLGRPRRRTRGGPRAARRPSRARLRTRARHSWRRARRPR